MFLSCTWLLYILYRVLVKFSNLCSCKGCSGLKKVTINQYQESRKYFFCSFAALVTTYWYSCVGRWMNALEEPFCRVWILGAHDIACQGWTDYFIFWSMNWKLSKWSIRIFYCMMLAAAFLYRLAPCQGSAYLGTLSVLGGARSSGWWCVLRRQGHSTLTSHGQRAFPSPPFQSKHDWTKALFCFVF